MAVDPSGTSLPLAITSGDPAGVGPEVILDWAKSYQGEREGLVFFGPEVWVNELRQLGYTGRGLGFADYEAKPGEPDRQSSLIARDALMKAAYFSEQWGGTPAMSFVGKKLKVVLATWHMSLHDMFHELSPVSLIRAVTQADYLARVYGAKHPQIGVCGLNPHAGENGLLGAEEQEWIDPMLDDLRDKYPGVSSAQPADTLFWRANEGEFDVVVALYHDQGLIPVKTLEFDQAVNVTLGLPYVRTSPDHGTGYSIAGKGKARSTSFAHAVSVAQKLVKYKSESAEVS
jgi:4-hydroxythreonine-4-phosphate dehydrogenase